MSGKVALDTNIAIAALNGEPAVINKLQNADQIFLPLPVVGELLFGAMNSQRAEANLSRIQQLIRHSTILQMGSETASLYAKTRMILKQKGRPIPENDIWIAASCLENQMVIMTNDAHFRSIEGLAVEALS